MVNPWAEYIGEYVYVIGLNFHLTAKVRSCEEDFLGNCSAVLDEIRQIDDTNEDGPTKEYPQGNGRKVPYSAVESGIQRLLDIWPTYYAKRKKEGAKK